MTAWPFSREKRVGDGRAASAPQVVDVREAYSRARKGARLIDVRSEAEFSSGHPRLARNVSPALIKSGETGLDHSDDVLVICLSGHRSSRAAKTLMARGFTHVSDVRGGLLAWRKAGLPVDA